MIANFLNFSALMLSGLGLLLGFSLVDRWWRERTFSVNGKTILITGGSRGLGLTMAHQLLAEGARVAVCARDTAELNQAQTDLQQGGREVLALQCDVTQQDQVERMIQQVRDRFGSIDILINNAGTDFVGPMENMTLEDFDDAMKLHFWAPLYTTYAVLPEMRDRKAGRIVNISSIGGKVSFPHMLPYCASKFALVGLSEGLRIELAQAGIIVTTVCPGLVRTGAPYNATFKGQNRKEFAWFNIIDGLPFLSQSAEKVARQTIAALKRGDAEVILSPVAQLNARFHGLFPGISSNLSSILNRMLPKPGGIGNERALGRDSQSKISPSFLSGLGDRAAQEHNQFAGNPSSLDQAADQSTDQIANDQLINEQFASHQFVGEAQSIVEVPTVEQAPVSEDPPFNNDLSSTIQSASGQIEPLEPTIQPEQPALMEPLVQPERSDSAEVTRADQSLNEMQRAPETVVEIRQMVAFDQSFSLTTETAFCLSEIQDTLDIPWTPDNWYAYAAYPEVMQLFWERLKPASQTEKFLAEAIALTELVYRSVNDWYQPGYDMDLTDQERNQIQRELNAFIYGNAQLILQQFALSRTLMGEVVGQEGNSDRRQEPGGYRYPAIELISQPDTEDLQKIYQDIQQTLGVTIVSAEYQALARWSQFFPVAWQDIKTWRERPEYTLLQQVVIERANAAANRLSPTIVIGEREVRDRLTTSADYDRLQQTVQMFTDLMPDLFVQDTLFHYGSAGVRSVLL